MVYRLAGAAALVVFALCLVVGGLEAHNPFHTTVQRALAAMVGTLVIGLIIGLGFQTMLNENLAQEAKKLEKTTDSPVSVDR